MAKRRGGLQFHDLPVAGGVKAQLDLPVGQAPSRKVEHACGILRVGAGVILGEVAQAVVVAVFRCVGGQDRVQPVGLLPLIRDAVAIGVLAFGSAIVSPGGGGIRLPVDRVIAKCRAGLALQRGAPAVGLGWPRGAVAKLYTVNENVRDETGVLAVRPLRRIRLVESNGVAPVAQVAAHRAEQGRALRDVVALGQALGLLRFLDRVEFDHQCVLARSQSGADRELIFNTSVDPPRVDRVQRVVQRHGPVGDVSQLDELVVRRAGAVRQRGGMVHDFMQHDRPDAGAGVGFAGALAKGGERDRLAHAKRRPGEGDKLVALAGLDEAERDAVLGRVELDGDPVAG